MHRHDMGMHVGDVRASEEEADTLHAIKRLHFLAKALPQMHDRGGKLWRQIIVIVVMSLRNDEHVPGPYGVDVEKCLQLLVFIDNVRRNLARRDATEDAVVMMSGRRRRKLGAHGDSL